MARRSGDIFDMMSGMGVGMAILQALTDEMEDAGLPLTTLHRLVKTGGMSVVEAMVATMAEEFGLLGELNGGHSITIDRSLTVEGMVLSARFDRRNADISSRNFPLELANTREETEVDLLSFDQDTPVFGKQDDHDVSTNRVLGTMRLKSLRPAKLAEILAFGAQYPDLQREFPIIGLGSRCDFSRVLYCPVLCGDGLERELDLRFYDNDEWDPNHRFLAVPKAA